MALVLFFFCFFVCVHCSYKSKTWPVHVLKIHFKMMSKTRAYLENPCSRTHWFFFIILPFFFCLFLSSFSVCPCSTRYFKLNHGFFLFQTWRVFLCLFLVNLKLYVIKANKQQQKYLWKSGKKKERQTNK